MSQQSDSPTEMGIDRRQFVGMLAGSIAAIPVGAEAAAFQQATWRDAIIINGLGDLPWARGGGKLSAASIDEIRRSGLTGLITTAGNQGNIKDAYEQLLADLDRKNAFLAANPDILMPVRTAADVLTAKRTARLGVAYTVQDGAWIGAEFERIGVAKAKGLRIVQLTYNKANLAGDGSLEPRNAGLSDLGRKTIEAIEAERLVLDLSHGGLRTVSEAISQATRPMLISHTGARAVYAHPRSMDDEQLKACADKGGCCGVYFINYLAANGKPTRETLIAHLTHFLNVCGEDHISIGTDGGISAVANDAAARERNRRFYEDRKAKGIAAPGEGPDVFNHIEDYNTPDRLQRLAEDLSARNWPARRIEKLLGANYLRVCREIWGS